MTKWSRNFEKCQQCGTKRFKHKAKGLCTRCYRLVRKLDQVTAWNLSDAKTLKGYPREECFHNAETLAWVRPFVARQIEERLYSLKAREIMLESPISGLDLEDQFRNIARLCGVKNDNLLFGIASYINFHFNPEQKKILYSLFSEIQETIPWKGIDWKRPTQL